MCNRKKMLRFYHYKNFIYEAHNVYTKEINKIALSSNYDKRLQTFDNITSHPCGSSVGKVC